MTFDLTQRVTQVTEVSTAVRGATNAADRGPARESPGLERFPPDGGGDGGGAVIDPVVAKMIGGGGTGQRKHVSIPAERSSSVVTNACESISRILSSDIRTVKGGGGSLLVGALR